MKTDVRSNVMSFRRHLAAIVLLASAITVHADPQIIETGAQRVTMVELFTSQGCSSCPPADAWLSRLRPHEGLWRDFIPVAWHVDYWNYLGWRDPFSSSAYSTRHRSYKHSGGVSVVYTPGFVVDGREWGNWRYVQTPPRSMKERPGPLRIERDGERVAIEFRPTDMDGEERLTAHTALLGMGRETGVSAGENHGMTLREDFIVLAHRSGRSQGAADLMCWQLILPEIESGDVAELALVAWVSRSGDPAPVQAVGGPLSQQ